MGDFHEFAARLVEQGKGFGAAFADRPGTQIARELGVSYPCLKEWKRRYQGDATPARADWIAENRALKAELTRVREQRDILKKTLGILSEPLKSATSGSKA